MGIESEKKRARLFLGIGLFFVLILLITSAIFLILDKPKCAWIEISKVYSEFDMKKELEAKYGNVEQMRKTILDSLELQLNMLSKRIQLMGEKEKDESE